MSNTFIDDAKVMSKGQVTIPKAVRDALGIETGDHVTFIVNGNSVQVVNAAAYGMKLLQAGMIGEAEKNGISSEEDIVNLIKETRKDYKTK